MTKLDWWTLWFIVILTAVFALFHLMPILGWMDPVNWKSCLVAMNITGFFCFVIQPIVKVWLQSHGIGESE